MRNCTILRRSLMSAIAFAAVVAAYGLMSPTEAQAANGASSVRRVGYRHGARRVASRHGRVRSYGSQGRQHGNTSYAPVNRHNYYVAPRHGYVAPRHGVYYNPTPHYTNPYYGYGGHQGSGLSFSFGF